MKDDVIAQLSGKLMALTARMQEFEQNNNHMYHNLIFEAHYNTTCFCRLTTRTEVWWQ
jgi:hypothetical protein